MKPAASLLILGAGDRGNVYARYALEAPDRARVVGIAEPRADRRQALAAAHGVPETHQFECWETAMAAPKMADAVVIATPDVLHLSPAIAAARAGYHLLLEKPMAPTESECEQIVDAVKAAGVMLAVGHVLRYTRYTETLRELLPRLGDMVSIQHLEPVGHWHMAHSFVRGNWCNTAESSCMLLAKSCHDLDWIHYLVGRPVRRIASVGSLMHFRPENRPAEAADRCLDCPLIECCAYSAPKIYQGLYDKGCRNWPLSVLTTDVSVGGLRVALETGPYGRCVYACDNDVVDHQEVLLEFDDGVTASFTMSGFAGGERTTRIVGTRGELFGDGQIIRVTNYASEEVEEIKPPPLEGPMTGHGGGDGRLMRCFVEALLTGDSSHIRSGPEETLASHRLVFAAERDRLKHASLPS